MIVYRAILNPKKWIAVLYPYTVNKITIPNSRINKNLPAF